MKTANLSRSFMRLSGSSTPQYSDILQIQSDTLTVIRSVRLIGLLKSVLRYSRSSPERFGRGLVEMLRKQYDELWSKITEVEVDKWAGLVDAERRSSFPFLCC